MPNLLYEKVIEQNDLAFATEGSAAFDLRGFFTEAYKELLKDQGFNTDQAVLQKGETIVLRTGIKFDIPEGYVLKVFIRSGLGFKHDVSLVNSVGIIDSDYKKEVNLKIIAKTEAVKLIDGMRYAQGILERVEPVALLSGYVSDNTGRGGFGSTGVD